jgi:hypothetical protein
MATVAASVPRVRSVRFRPVFVVAALCFAAVALYVWIRASVAAELRAPFAELCGDVLRSGDWPCRLTRTDFVATFTGGAFLIGLGVALPGVILALSGRRLSALVPAALAAAGAWAIEVVALPGGSSQPFGIAESFLGSGDGRAYWQVHAELAILADLLLVSVPALAIALVLRPPRRARPSDLPRHAVWASTIAIGAAIGAIRLAWPHLPHEQYLAAPFDDVAISMTLMVLFGSMLGTDRRWWPWALVPAAVLLSLGPAAAVMAIPSNLTAFTWFGDALPLLVVGLVASLWRPLATWFAKGRTAETRSTAAASGRRSVRRRVRPLVVVNALAAALLLASVLAARFDPLGIQIGTSLPTYLGARELAQDVRTKTNLAGAIEALDAYRAEHGTYRGFDAAAGESSIPELAWSDVPTGEELVVRIAETSGSSARVLANSGSGAVFCAEASASGARYGEGSRVPLALASCDSTPFTAASFRMLDVEAFCDGVDDGAILLCRSVQRLIRQILATPAPA